MITNLKPDSDTILRQKLFTHLSQRAYPKTICPSEVARSLSAAEIHAVVSCSSDSNSNGNGNSDSNWRDAMPAIREVAWRMRDEDGSVEILQGGMVLGEDVGVGDVRGPIRLRFREEWMRDEDDK